MMLRFIQEKIQWRDIDDGKKNVEHMCIAKKSKQRTVALQ